MALSAGTIIDERYRVIGRIGYGGMSEVYEAVDIINRKTVAVKMIREDVMKNPVNFKRFRNEAAIAASFLKRLKLTGFFITSSLIIFTATVLRLIISTAS